jgi:ribosome-binding protein aMBF1 (putative translation factor)
MQDKMRKGRHYAPGPNKPNTPSGRKHWARRHPEWVHRGPKNQGAANPKAKLTEDMVRVMRERYAAGGCTQDELAKKYGVRQGTVTKIINGQLWASVK